MLWIYEPVIQQLLGKKERKMHGSGSEKGYISIFEWRDSESEPTALSSYFESVGIGVHYREGKDTAFLEEMEVKYTPGVCGYGGHTEQRMEKCIYHIMQVKILADKLLYAPLLQKTIDQNSKFDRIELLQILNRLLCERRKLEAAAILPVEEPMEEINQVLFTKDELYDEFICTWEED